MDHRSLSSPSAAFSTRTPRQTVAPTSPDPSPPSTLSAGLPHMTRSTMTSSPFNPPPVAKVHAVGRDVAPIPPPTPAELKARPLLNFDSRNVKFRSPDEWITPKVLGEAWTDMWSSFLSPSAITYLEDGNQKVYSKLLSNALPSSPGAAHTGYPSW